MHLNITIGPTNVSFYKVQMLEVGYDATDVTGYFTNHWPASHKTSGADLPHWIGYDNVVGDNMDNCFYAGNGVLPSPWPPGGSFKWPIPAVWRVGFGLTNPLPWSDQTFSLDPDGTMTITKFGHSVTRTPQDVITTH